MTHDSTFRLNGTVRLLHEGVHSERPPHDRLADPFPADHAAGSALWNGLPEAAFTMPGTSTACPYLEQFFTAPVSQTGNTPETASVPAPVYLCGSATSSMDVARALAAHGQLPVWGSVLALSQRSGRGQLGRQLGFARRQRLRGAPPAPEPPVHGHGPRPPPWAGSSPKR